MTFSILYHPLVSKDDIPKLPAAWKKNIQRSIGLKLVTRPEIYGKPLRRALKNFRKLRVGDYRIVFRIEGHSVKIFAIQHRSIVYSTAEKRAGN